MGKNFKGVYSPRPVDRAVFAALSFLCIANGSYLIGPWYLEVRPGGNPAPLFNMFNSAISVNLFGFLLLLVGVGLFYATVHKGGTAIYTKIVSTTLLSGFLLRLYSTIGVILTVESWRPPSYLSQMVTVVVLGVYWVWVNVSARTTQ